MTLATSHTQACFNVWMNCEDLLKSLHEAKNTLSHKVTKVIDECAHICMGTFHALKTRSTNSERFAVLCIGICEECAELCEGLKGEAFERCARLSRECSETMTALAFTNLQ